MPEQYPKRESHFAHRFVRILHKSCAAQDIGTSAFALLCVIVHTEDASRYRGPCRFWNSQLMETLGFKSPKQLDAARDKAIEFGWLYYNRAGNRQVGEYYVIIPDRYLDITDSPIEEPIHSEYGTNSGMNNGTNGERKPERLGNGNGTESGKPSIPNPNPIPIPNTKADKPPVVFEIPENLQNEKFIATWKKWTTHRKEIKKPITKTAGEQQLKQLSVWGTERAVSAIETSIANSWQGIFENKSAMPAKPTPEDSRSELDRLYPEFKKVAR